MNKGRRWRHENGRSRGSWVEEQGSLKRGRVEAKHRDSAASGGRSTGAQDSESDKRGWEEAAHAACRAYLFPRCRLLMTAAGSDDTSGT